MNEVFINSLTADHLIKNIINIINRIKSDQPAMSEDRV